jgi:hypothetical protein
LLALLSITVAFLAICSFLLVPASGEEDMRMTVTVVEGRSIIMNYSVAAGPYEREVSAVALEVNRIHQGPIYILINDNLEFQVRVSLQRMADHFNNELPLMGSKVTATVIDVEDLPLVFSDTKATLVCGPGASLPDYFGYPARQWVEKGGLWVGIGNGSAPFMYSGANTGTPNATLRLDFTDLDFDGGSNMVATPMAAALDLMYVAPEHPFLLTDLEVLGGTSIGYEFDRGNKLATAGIVPLGEGALMIVGGNMTAPPLATGEEVLAWDLERILLLNVPWWSGHFRHVTERADGWVIQGSIDMPLSGSGFVACGLFSTSDSFSAVKVERVAVQAVR